MTIGLLHSRRNVARLSGTLPSLAAPDHWAQTQMVPADSLHPRAIGLLGFEKIFSLSGTIPDTAYCNGNNIMKLAAICASKISGTVPACLASRLVRASSVYLYKSKYSGTVPDFSNSKFLQILRVERNNFDALPTDFPPSLEQFMASQNPGIDTNGHNLSVLIDSMHNLRDFSFTSDDMVARSTQFSIQHGTIPDMAWSNVVPTTPLDCRIGEPCTMTLHILIGISFLPMNSIGLNFELRMDPVPTELDEHTLSFREHLFVIEEERERNRNNSVSGRRQLDEALPLDEAFSDDNADGIMSEGPHIRLSDGLSNLTLISPMQDNWDGSCK